MNDFPILPLITTLACLLALRNYIVVLRCRAQLSLVISTLVSTQKLLQLVLTDETVYEEGKRRLPELKKCVEEIDKAVNT